MKTKVARWGNSLALRIPSRLASSYRLAEGSHIEIIEDEGELKLRPIESKKPTLESLLARVKDENLHGEFETGLVEGTESW